MRTIFKQKLEVTDRQVIEMPEDFKILHLGMQEGEPVIWYECTTDKPLVKLDIRCFGTGYVMDGQPAMAYIGTIQDLGVVWHYYRALNVREE